MSLKMNVHFAPGKGGRRVLRKGRRPSHAKPTRLPRVTRLMALAIKYEHLLGKGVVETHEQLAMLAGVDRSQISAVLRLRLLAPQIQEWLLNLPELEKRNDPIGWTAIQKITRIASWEEQRRQLNELIAERYPFSAPKASILPKVHKPEPNKEKYNDN